MYGPIDNNIIDDQNKIKDLLPSKEASSPDTAAQAAGIFLNQVESLTTSLQEEFKDAQNVHQQAAQIRSLLSELRSTVNTTGGIDAEKNEKLQKILTTLEEDFGVHVPKHEDKKGNRTFVFTKSEVDAIIDSTKMQIDSMLSTGEFKMMRMDRMLKMKNLVIEMLAQMLHQMNSSKKAIFAR